MEEIQTKLAGLRRLLELRGLDGALLQRNSSFAWATGGSSAAINIASTTGEAALLITQKDAYILTNNIEATRLEGEEDLCSKGFQFYTHAWHGATDAFETIAKGMKLGADVAVPGLTDLSGELARLRVNLLPIEQDRLRKVGRDCALAMSQAVHAVRPGQSEQEIASLLAAACLERGVEPIVNLIATDERIYRFRHPTYSAKTLERYAMLVLCGRKHGLVVSITRFVHFGPLNDELKRKSAAVARIDAAIIAATRPGRTLGQVFSAAQAAYASAGYPAEWQLHHQGGPAGYEPREYLALPGSADLVEAGQAYAWNPSITGAKSEDTVLVTLDGCEVVSEVPGWPVEEIQSGGLTLHRPMILVV